MSTRLLCIGLCLLSAGCAGFMTFKRSPSGGPSGTTSDGMERLVRGLDTSLLVSRADLRAGLLSIRGHQTVVPTPDPPAGLSGFGFANGSMDNRRTIDLAIILRGRRIDMPKRHWSDLYNLAYQDRHAMRFGSCSWVDVILIRGSGGERGYEVIYFVSNGYYLGRRVSTLFEDHDDFSWRPAATSTANNKLRVILTHPPRP